MYIESIHIDSFGSVKNRDFDFSDGLNIIEGKNESGKTTLAMFIKFMLYGFPAGNKKDVLGVHERDRYIPWDSGVASGTMTVFAKGKRYKIEREAYAIAEKDSTKRASRIIDAETGERVFKDEEAGQALLGMPEELFVNTVFVNQLGSTDVDGKTTLASIENILQSGDENMNTEKAVVLLDTKVRRPIKHAQGEGGKYYDALRELQRLSSNRDTAIGAAAETIELEAYVYELDMKIKAKEREAEECGKLADAYGKICEYKRVLDARACGEELRRNEAEIAEYAKYGAIRPKIREIENLSQEIDKDTTSKHLAEERIAELEKRLPPVMSFDEEKAARDDVRRAEKAQNGKKLIKMGILFLVLCAALVVVDILFLTEVYNLICLGAAGLFLAVGGLSIIFGCLKSKDLKAIMQKWEVTRVDALEPKVEEYIEFAAIRRDPDSEYGKLLEKKRADAGNIEMNTKALCEICSEFCEGAPDIETLKMTALENANRLQLELDILSAKNGELSGKYSAMAHVLGDDNGEELEKTVKELLETAHGKKASSMTREEANDALSRKRFAESTLPEMRDKFTERKSKLAVLKTTTENPADIEMKIDKIREEIKMLDKKFEAVTLAMDTLKTASESLRREFIPRVAEEAGKMTGNICDGKYSEMRIDSKMQVSVDALGKTRKSLLLSAGTRDALYICLRCALARNLFPEDTPPQFFDESFAKIDEERLKKILAILSLYEEKTQSFVFTCRNLEGEIAEKLEGARVISLD